MAEETEIKIIENSARLFSRYGIKSVTMDEIARSMGMSKKTIYQYFKDKNEMVFRIMEHLINSKDEQYCSIMHSQRPVLERLSELVQMFKQEVNDMSPSIIYDMQKYHHDAYQLFSKHLNECVNEYMMHTIRDGKAEGCFRPTVDEKLIASFYVSGIQAFFEERTVGLAGMNLQDVKWQLTELIVRGMLTVEGLAQWEKLSQQVNQESALPAAQQHR